MISRWRAALVLVSLVLATIPLVPTVAGAQTPTALFVTGNVNSLSGGDVPVRDQLVALGYDVTLADDNSVEANDADGFDLVLISTNVKASAVGGKFADVAVPVIVWEPFIYDDMGFTGSGARGHTATTTTVAIADPGHPIAAGLVGSTTVSTAANKLTYGVVGGAAQIIATHSTTGNPVVFAYDRGDAMGEGIAPERRVGLYMSALTAKTWTAAGSSIFDAAVAWATSGPPPANTAPIVNLSDDIEIALGAVLALDGQISDDGQPLATPTTLWTAPPGVTIDDPTAVQTTATFPGIGTYVLTLTADDSALTGADDLVVTVSADGPPAIPEVLWVTNKPVAPSSDAPGIARLEGQGINVTVIDDNVAEGSDADGMDLVIISSNVSPSRVDQSFDTLAVPIFTWEAFIYDDLGFVSGSGTKGQATNFKRIDIEDESHPAAGGLSGSPDVLTVKKPMSWAKPAGDATIIATLDNSTTRATVFTYEGGAAMDSAPAPARRVGFFLTASGLERMTTDGWAIWDAAIDWAIQGAPPSTPVAAATADVTAGPAPLTVNFDASTSTDPNDDIVSYDWDFGDGTTGSGATASHTYLDPGSYDAVVTVTDSQGLTDTATVTVQSQSQPGPPVATATADVTAGPAPLTVNFDASTSTDPNDDIVSYDWDFGDGTTGSGATPNHLYATGGSYDAVVTVTDSQGLTDTATVTVTPTDDPPLAAATIDTSGGFVPLDVTVDASGSTDLNDDIVSYDWDFGDGSTASGVSATHQYTTPGEYDAVVTVTDSQGLTDTASVHVSVTTDWAATPQHFRVQLTADAGAHTRVDEALVVDIDFGQLLASLGATDATLDPDSIHVVEVDTEREVLADPATFQFDPAADFDATTNAVGEIVVLLDGTTTLGQQRLFDVYFDTAGRSYTPATPAPVVEVITGGLDEGKPTIEIDTPSGNWFFDPAGGGFSSLDDIDGNDWISHNSAAGASGQFRGIPNAVHPQGYLRPGAVGATTTLISTGPTRATFETISPDDQFVARWDVYPTHAEMTMMQAGGAYWFLYEGTPGGSLNGTVDRLIRPNGVTVSTSNEFTGDLVDDEWVAIADTGIDRSIVVAHLEDDTIADRYYPILGKMTVLGFGRETLAVPLLTAAPQSFLVSLLEVDSFTLIDPAIDRLRDPASATVSPIETRIPGAIPPRADIVAAALFGELPFTASLDGSGSSDDGTVALFDWDFGDGTTASGTFGSPTYDDTGAYVATLTVTDDDGITDTDSVVLSAGRGPLDRLSDGLLALYEFEETSGSTVADTSAVGAALDLTIADPANVTHLVGGGLQIHTATKIESPAAATKIVAGATATNELTVEAWISPENLTQNGPARIVGMSSTTSQRNFMVGQGVFNDTANRLEARLRTSTTDDNGKPATRTPSGSFTAGLRHVVYTRDAAGAVSVYVDGTAVADDNVPGDFSNWDATMALLLGNEADSSRPWLGDLHLVAIYDRAFTPQDVCNNRSAGPGHGLGPGNIDPILCLTSNSTGGEAPASITFDASVSRDLDGAIVDFTWDLGDGTELAGASDIISHQFTEAGSFTVRVTATDDQGATSFAETDVSITTPIGGRLNWTRIESPSPRLANPEIDFPNDQQTATLIGDLDGDGDNDFVIGTRREPAPSIVWYEYEETTGNWLLHVIEPGVVPVDAGGDIFDVDSDGDLDIVFGGDGSNDEMWWWENPTTPTQAPTGTWTRHQIKQGGLRQHHDFRFADVDGDSVAELVFWNQQPRPGGDKLMLAEIPANPATAGLWTFTEIFAGATPSEGMDIADIDGNGVVDIVGAGFWFDRQPDGSFTPNPIDPTYTFSRTAVGQLIPGGRPEIVIDSGDTIGPLNWYEWDEFGLVWVKHELLAASRYGHSLRLADFDDDGNLDIFTAEMASPFDSVNVENPEAATRIYFGDGAGGFDLDTIDTGFDHHESRVGDLDDDGDIDILGKPFNIDAPGVNIWLNDGVNAFGRWERAEVDGARPWTALFVKHADIDGDSYPDIVTGGWWYENPAPAAGAWTRHEIGAPMYNVADVHDLDGDGDIDILGTAWQSSADNPNSTFSWARNDGAGNFSVFAAATTGDGPFLQGAVIAPLEVGGPLELVLSWNQGTPGTKTITVPLDLATNPDQAPWAQKTLSALSEGEEVVPSDLDGDGDTDLLLGSNWLRNDPADVWTTIPIFTLGTGLPDRIVLSDIDGDGDDDAVIGNGHDPAGELSWYERPANPEDPWTQHLIANLVNPQSVDVTDLDGDGDFDVLVGEHNKDDLPASRLRFYENLGAGATWKIHLIHAGDEHHDGAQLVDLDLDGDLDVISIGFIQNRVLAYYNRSGD